MDEFDTGLATEGQTGLATEGQTGLATEGQTDHSPHPEPGPHPAQVVSQIPPTERLVDVTDTTATPRYPKRIHEIVVDGRVREYEFKFGETPTRMPFAHGMKFLHIPSFEVRHLDGTLIPPLPNFDEQGNSGAPPVLRPSQVIAELDELSEESLVRRCNAISGGERMMVENGQDSLVRFLLNREIRKREAAASKEAVETDVGVATITNEPTDKAMDSLFAGMSGDA